MSPVDIDVDTTSTPGLQDRWRKSSRCEAGSCVEVAVRPGNEFVHVRDSKLNASPELIFGAAGWRKFLAGLRAGEFDNR